MRGFPDGPGVKVLPSSAGVTGSTPGQGRTIPHALLAAKKEKT